MIPTLLIAEDDPAANRLLTRFLTLKGFETISTADGTEALNEFILKSPDLVILDVNMPKMDGWSVLKEIRSISNAPVLMVTVNDRTEDKVKGLSEGADDYVTKPFDLQEIEARIRAILRRYQKAAAEGPVTVGVLSIDDSAKEVHVQGNPVSLSPKEYEVLNLLARQPGRVFSTDEILRQVWPDRADEATPEEVKKYVYFLRSKLGDDPQNPRFIETVRGFGYKLKVAEK